MRLSTRKIVRACTTLSIGATLLVMAPAVALAAISHNGQEVSAGDSYTVNEFGTCQGHVFSGTSEDDWYNPAGGQHITVSGGTHTITLNGLTIDDPGAGSSAINIRDGANVTLVLKGENYLEASGNHPGIWVEEGSSLTIEGDGSLVVYAGNTTAGLGAAGIGGGYNESAFGNITINSGSVEAHGRAGGAGIGGGYKTGSGTQTGDVTITGGFVQAYGGSVIGSSGAGIGAGENADYDGTITISGGVVRAMGGNENKSSIGGGGSLLGSTDNGTFTTGTNGNAVIAAPWGIGDTSDVANWDCILLEPTRESTSEIQFVNYDATMNTITFEGGTPRVYGDVEADYNITINSPASLRVDTEIDLDGDPSTPNNAPSTLTMKSGTTLTNNNKSSDPGIAGIALMPGSTLVLEDGTSQCQGSGTMIATSTEGTGLVRGKVQLPLSDDMVSVNPTSYVYDGTEKEPAVTVQFPKWNFTQTFEQGTEYTVAYEHNVNVGMAKAIATSAGGNLLNTVDGNASTGTAGFEITQGDFTVSTVARRYIQVGEEHLLSKLPTKPTFGANNPPNVDGGTFSWYSDEACTTPLTDTFVQNEPEGAQITVYWKYTQTGNPNVVPTKTGKTVLVMTNEKPPAVQVDGKTDDTSIHATYGDPSYTPDIKISLDGGQSWIAPLSDVTYSVDSQTPAGNGGVVTVDEKTGEIQFVGAGTATVIAEIDAYTDPDATADDKGDSYGAAYITIEVKVDPKQVTVDESSVQAVDRAYNGTRKVEVTAELTAAETVGTDLADDAIGVAATGEAAQPAVGTDISVTVTYTLTGDKADDYVLTNDPGTTVAISKAQAGDDTLQGKTGELTISNCAAATYVFDLNELVPDSKQVEGGALYPGWIEFENPVVNISDDRYFTVDDIRIDNATHTLYLTVNDVESQDVDELGTITLDMVSPNFEGMTGIITIKRENLDIYTITASAGEGGTISPEGAVEVVTGHSQDFAISADEGYEIADVVVDGVSQGALSTYRFEDVTANHTIEVTFKSVDESTEPSDGDDAPGSDAGSDDDALLGTGDSSLLMVAGTMCVGAASVAGGLVLARKRR